MFNLEFWALRMFLESLSRSVPDCLIESITAFGVCCLLSASRRRVNSFRNWSILHFAVCWRKTLESLRWCWNIRRSSHRESPNNSLDAGNFELLLRPKPYERRSANMLTMLMSCRRALRRTRQLTLKSSHIFSTIDSNVTFSNSNIARMIIFPFLRWTARM